MFLDNSFREVCACLLVFFVTDTEAEVWSYFQNLKAHVTNSAKVIGYN